jgi:polar amino acid transport system ATP-binding protein
VSDTIVFMHQGRVWESGPPERIFDAPQTAELRKFVQ